MLLHIQACSSHTLMCLNIGTPKTNTFPSTTNGKNKWFQVLLAEYRALVNTNLHFKLFTVPLTNTDTAFGLGIHSLYQTRYPLIHTKFPQCPPNDSPGHSAKCLLQVYESHVKSLVGSWILFLQLPDDKDCICCASTWDKAKLGIMD